MIDPTKGDRLVIRVDAEPDDLPDSVRDALRELSEALAAEEIVLGDEITEAIDAESEVAGFSATGNLTLGQINLLGSGGGKYGTRPDNHWCIVYSQSKSSCGVFGKEDWESDTDTCWIRVV